MNISIFSSSLYKVTVVAPNVQGLIYFCVSLFYLLPALLVFFLEKS